MKTYSANVHQSIFDVCLFTYASPDYAVKLMLDNNINGIDEPVESGQTFEYDQTITVQVLRRKLPQSNPNGVAVFNTVADSSVWDMILNTYGSADKAVQLMKENAISGIDNAPSAGTALTYDRLSVANLNEQNQITSMNAGIVYMVTGIKSTDNYNPMYYYKEAQNHTYIAVSDGEYEITISQLIGMDVFRIDKELMPLTSSDWSFNKTSGKITLTSDNKLIAGERLSILYNKQINL